MVVLITACGNNPLTIGGSMGMLGYSDAQTEHDPRCSWVIRVNTTKVSGCFQVNKC